MEENVNDTVLNNVEINWEERFQEINDKYTRLFAEFENYRKRVSKEKEEIKQSTKASVMSAILDVDSDLHIALKNEKDNPGIKMIVSKLDTFLKNQGIESIQTETYDPDTHEVVSVLDIGESKIVDVVSKGYMIGGKPVRYPKIILGK